MFYDLFILGLKASACTGVLYVFFKLLLARETFYRINRIIILIGMALSFILPLFVVTITQEVEMPTITETITVDYKDTEEPVSNNMIVKDILGIVYVAGIIAMLIRMVMSITNIMKFIRNKENKVQNDGTSTIITTDKRIGAFSWLKYIVVSKFEDANDSKLIIMHEQGHIHMHHTYDLLYIDLLGAFQWYNPFLWMIRAELKNIHEFEADNYVLSKGADPKEYQMLLIKKAVGASRYSVTNSFDHNKLKTRIFMMLDEKSSKLARAKALLMLPLLCIGVMAFAETDYVYAVDKGSEKSIETVKNDSLKVLYVVDGVKTESIDGLKAADINHMLVLKGTDAAAYGAFDKVIDITTVKNVKEIIVHGCVKDEDGHEVIGAVVKVYKGDTKTVTDRNGRFTLKAKNTDIITVSYTGYGTVNMKANEKMTFVLKYKSLDEKEEKEPSENQQSLVSLSSSVSSSSSTLNGKVTKITTTRTIKDNKDGGKDVSNSVHYNDGNDALVIKDNNNNPLLITRNGSSMENPTVYVDGKKVESLEELNLQPNKILSIVIDKSKNKILITLKKDGVKYPTQKEIVKSQKHLNGKGKKYYVTTHEGKTDVIRAKNETEAIRYCQTHYDKNVLLLKRPNGGVIKVVKPIK